MISVVVWTDFRYHAFLRVNLRMNLCVQCDMYTVMLMNSVDLDLSGCCRILQHVHGLMYMYMYMYKVMYRSRGQQQTVSKYPELGRIEDIRPSVHKHFLGGHPLDSPEGTAPSGPPTPPQPNPGPATGSYHFCCPVTPLVCVYFKHVCVCVYCVHIAAWFCGSMCLTPTFFVLILCCVC